MTFSEYEVYKIHLKYVNQKIPLYMIDLYRAGHIDLFEIIFNHVLSKTYYGFRILLDYPEKFHKGSYQDRIKTLTGNFNIDISLFSRDEKVQCLLLAIYRLTYNFIITRRKTNIIRYVLRLLPLYYARELAKMQNLDYDPSEYKYPDINIPARKRGRKKKIVKQRTTKLKKEQVELLPAHVNLPTNPREYLDIIHNYKLTEIPKYLKIKRCYLYMQLNNIKNYHH